MKIERTQIGTVEVFTPVGALVDADAEQFNSQLMQRLRAPNARVVVAMHEVPYMDSGAIEGLLTASDELKGRAAQLKLVKMTPTCREILELTGWSSRFAFFEETQDAVRSFL